jgi:hypothetical protein
MTEAVKASGRKESFALDPVGITLRHIRQGTSSSSGAKEVLGVYYYPDPIGLNGKNGFQSGTYECKLEEEGSFSIKLPNTAGQDGLLHRERLAVISDAYYRPGDEFIEIWRDKDLLFVGTPVSYDLGFASITISGFSPFWLLKKTRETATGYWANAPRDVMENYLSLWQAVVGKDTDGDTYVYSAVAQTTTDGWEYTHGENAVDSGSLKLRSTGVAGSAGILISPSFEMPFGTKSPTPGCGWRMEARVNLKGIISEGGSLFNFFYIQLGSSGLGPVMEINPSTILCRGPASSPTDLVRGSYVPDGDHSLAIEYRGRWFYFYFDGKLVGLLEERERTNWTVYKKIKIVAAQNGTSQPIEATIYNVLLRRQRPFLRNPAQPGDYSLPGAPTPGGLEGHYHMDQDIWAQSNQEKVGKLLHPSREVDPASSDSGGLYQRRLDKAINFPSASLPNVWQPPGPPGGEHFSCRWVGSIYLDLTNYDFAMRIQSDDRGRVWIGKTRLGDEYIEDWNSAGHGITTFLGNWIKAGSASGSAPSGATGVLAGMKSGWYPIVIEYSDGDGIGQFAVEYQRSDGIGTWQSLGAPSHSGEGNYGLPATSLLQVSPIGIYQDNIQFESHYEAFRKVAETFGYQWIETPQSLESGLFPGYVAPTARVGRDTEYILDSLEATEVANQGNADDVADSILAEAQGLGDPSQTAQLTIEEFNLPSLGRLYFAQEQESLSDLNIESLVRQRAESLLALHLAPWEEIGARPQGRRSLVDKFPLAGALAEFKWEPGDGLRLDFPEINVSDVNPRQIQGINWPFVPDRLGIPTASFKQRPRNMKLTLRKMLRGTISSQRNYQGQLVKIIGALGGNTGAAVDAYSRCVTPVNLADIAKATLVVQVKTDASTWTIEVNGVATGLSFNNPGAFDITPWVTREGNNPRCYARGVGGTAAVECQIVLLIRV